MIRGMLALLHSSEPEALRAFLRDKLGFPASDVGYGLATHFRVPGDFTIELYQPRYVKQPAGR